MANLDLARFDLIKFNINGLILIKMKYPKMIETGKKHL